MGRKDNGQRNRAVLGSSPRHLWSFFSKIVCNCILQTINLPESKVLISSGYIHTINYYIFTTLIFVFCLKEVVRNRTDAQSVV